MSVQMMAGVACDCAGTPLAGRPNLYKHFLAHCDAAAADILGQDVSANLY
jgi:hypothetical protein